MCYRTPMFDLSGCHRKEASTAWSSLSYNAQTSGITQTSLFYMNLLGLWPVFTSIPPFIMLQLQISWQLSALAIFIKIHSKSTFLSLALVTEWSLQYCPQIALLLSFLRLRFRVSISCSTQDEHGISSMCKLLEVKQYETFWNKCSLLLQKAMH